MTKRGKRQDIVLDQENSSVVTQMDALMQRVVENVDPYRYTDQDWLLYFRPSPISEEGIFPLSNGDPGK